MGPKSGSRADCRTEIDIRYLSLPKSSILCGPPSVNNFLVTSVPHCKFREANIQDVCQRAYARVSIIGTVALACSRAMSSKMKAVAGLPPAVIMWQPAASHTNVPCAAMHPRSRRSAESLLREAMSVSPSGGDQSLSKVSMPPKGGSHPSATLADPGRGGTGDADVGELV